MDNFNFNRDFYEACRALGERDGARLAYALLRYGYEAEEPDKLPGALFAAFTLAKGRVDAMVSGSQGGKRGASVKGGKTPPTPTADPSRGGSLPPKPGGSRGGTADPSPDPSQQKEKEKEIKKGEPNGSPKKAARFAAPRADQVKAYADEYAAAKGIAACFDAERFCDYYASRGWKVGSAPMRDWRATVRNWIRRDWTEGGKDDARFEQYA